MHKQSIQRSHFDFIGHSSVKELKRKKFTNSSGIIKDKDGAILFQENVAGWNMSKSYMMNQIDLPYPYISKSH